MTTRRSTPLAAWGKQLEHDLEAAGSSKRELARVLGIDYATLFKWLRKPLSPAKRKRIEAALVQIQSYRTGPTPTGVGTTDTTVAAHLHGLRALRARLDAAIAALEGVEPQRRAQEP